MTFVLDCSFCAALFLPHEKSQSVKSMFGKMGDNEVFVPVQFWEEMAELLLAAIKRDRLKYADALEINRLLTLYNFITEASFSGAYTVQLIDLASLYGTGIAEAAYLELAIRKNSILGTLNGKLKASCKEAGIMTLL